MAENALGDDGAAEAPAFDEILHTVMERPLERTLAGVRESVDPLARRVDELAIDVASIRWAVEHLQQVLAPPDATATPPAGTLSCTALFSDRHTELGRAVAAVQQQVLTLQHKIEAQHNAVARRWRA